jgi:uncharacterized protein (DUF1778 family)
MATTKKKMGAPPKPPAERRTYALQVMLNQAEREVIAQAAQARGAEVSTWVRELALKAAKRSAPSAKES